MAIRTGRIGWAECCTDMTSFTGDVGVCAIKNESGTEMIEWLLRGSIDLKQQEADGGEYGNASPVESTCGSIP